ncbi:MAG TPA: hypothetical protein VHL11_14750, partial [Phototrophicaceae bacterium]|nr:hypothetical protein [Phototrophicaceae bacterium]
MSSQQNNQLLQEATEAAREGDRAEAKRLLRQLLATDGTNVKAWMLLYRVAEGTEEKRTALEKILQFDPGNTKAQEALEKLEFRVKAEEEEEVAPGINRRQLILIFGGLTILALGLLGGVSLIINTNNNARRDEFNTATAFVAQQTEIAALETGSILTVTQAIIDATGTFFAINSATPTPTNTREGPPTLPQEFTPTPSPTPPVTPTNLPPPSDATGIIIGHGGSNLLNDGYYPIVSMPVNSITVPKVLTSSAEDRGLYSSAINSSTVIYIRYSRQTFETALVSLDVNAGTLSYLADLWQGTTQGIVADPAEADLSMDGTKVVFTAVAANNRNQVFIVDLTTTGDAALKR